ncbi:DnaJ domain-containing protein, partial [Colletotrichum zoysiae]
MAESPSRSGSLRVRRTRGGPSRNSSARSSAAWEDYSYLHPVNFQQQLHHSLRSASSRFSLNEQFAATRQEYEFGDDDASSIVERMTLASDLADDGAVAADTPAPDPDAPDGAEGDYYDLLCLPKDPSLTPDQIRRAYHRWVLYLHKDGLPENLHRVAQPYLDQVQRGFETLIDPHRRALYDATRLADATGAAGAPLDDDDDDDDYRYAYDLSLKEQLRQRAADVVQTSSDLGIRFDASRAVRESSAVAPLDFTLSHSVTVGLPVLGRTVERTAPAAGRRAASSSSSSSSKRAPSIALSEGDQQAGADRPREPATTYLPPPRVTLTGSVYGVVEETYGVPPPLLADRYQPLLPPAIPRKRVAQLAERRPCPLVSLRLRQDVVRRTAGGRVAAQTAVEVEGEVLPEPSLTARASHPVRLLPGDPVPVLLEGSVRSGRPWTGAPPRVGVGMRRRMGVGTAYAVADSGDWGASRPGETLRFLADFSRVSRDQLLAEFPARTPASFEAGYTTSPGRMPSTGHEGDSPRGECGIRGLDRESGTGGGGSWTASASLTADAVAGYLRYGRDLPPLLPGAGAGAGPARLEVELCSSTLLDRYVAARGLWAVGRFSRLGLELGVSPHGAHVSLYWSRLGQRLSVPVLLPARDARRGPSSSSLLLFYAGLAGLAA